MGPSPIAHANGGLTYVTTGGYLQGRGTFVQGVQSTSVNVGSSSSQSGSQVALAGIQLSPQCTPQSLRKDGLIGRSNFQSPHPGSTTSVAPVTPSTDHAIQNNAIGMVQNESGSQGVDRDKRVEIWEESKRTRQRKLQRMAKTVFKKNSADWPTKVPTTATGEIEEGYRVFVHRLFRAQARRFLKVETIKFKDHPKEKVSRTLELIRKQFTFEPDLPDEYILNNLEKGMSHCRYQWRNYWKATGRGDKHEQCPQESFPALVSYWKTKESEEEAKALELEMLENEERARIASLTGEAGPSTVVSPWDVRHVPHVYPSLYYIAICACLYSASYSLFTCRASAHEHISEDILQSRFNVAECIAFRRGPCLTAMKTQYTGAA